MYQGLPVEPTNTKFYAWTPAYGDAVPEWIDEYFPNTSPDNFIVYTKDPMKKFFMKKTDVIVRCTLGSVVFFAIIQKGWFQNWWVCDSAEVAPNKFSFEINREISNKIFEK